MTQEKKGGKVLAFPKKESKLRASEQKWGLDVMQLGFTIVPSLLFKAQDRLGLSTTQLAVLLQIADHWWDADRNPWPSKGLLATKLGIKPRQVQRVIADLEKRGYVKRIVRSTHAGGKLSNQYDFSGLAKALKKLAPEFKKADDEAREKRRAVMRKGGLRPEKTPK
jgi:DNA-binding transcriptional regulator YhcF (GntR family)